MTPHRTTAVLFLSVLVAFGQPAAAQRSEEQAFKDFERDMGRLPFLFHTRAREVLAGARSAEALDKLCQDYTKPRAVASMALSVDLVRDFARYTSATLFGRNFAHWSWADRFAKLRQEHRTPGDAWLWVQTAAIDGRPAAIATTLATARTDDSVLLRAATIASLARHGRTEVLDLIPEVCAAFPKAREAGVRRLLVGVMSDAILAHKDQLKSPSMQKAIRAYIGLLAADVKLNHSAKMVIARYLAKTIGKDRRYIEPEPWLQLLDRGFEPPKRAGNTVTTMRFFGIEAEGDRICYLVDMSNSMLKPIDPGLIPKGPITGRKKRRKKGQLPTEDDIPWHLVKTRFDLARWHLKISMQRLSKDKRFCVVWFGSGSGLFKSTPSMVKASRSKVKAVIRELDSIKAGPVPKNKDRRDAPHGWLRGETNLHGGLRRAFGMHSKGFAERYEYADLRALAAGCDTIFLLSDGAPSSDDFRVSDKDYHEFEVVADLESKRKVARPQTIVYHGPMDQPRWLQEEVRRLNIFRKVQIHCVGIGEADIGLLRGIASATDGQSFLFGAKAKARGARGR